MARLTDPSNYPVVFSLGKRSSVPLSSLDATSVIMSLDTLNPIIGASLRSASSYLVDINPFSDAVGQARSGGRVVYEFLPSVQDASTASLLVKIWLSSTSFKSVGGDSYSMIRQPPSSSGTTHVLSPSALFTTMPPVQVGAVSYYPSIKVSYSVRVLSDSFDGFFDSGHTFPRSNVDISIFPPDSPGVSMIVFDCFYVWYIDVNRTIPAAILPVGLPNIDSNVAVCVASTIDGRVYFSGRVSPSGIALFDGIDAGSDANLTAIYIGSDGAGGIFSNHEDVFFNSDGTPNQVGNNGISYILDGRLGPSSSSSSSGSSSSMSSSSFSSSSSNSSSSSISSSSLSSSSSSSSSLSSSSYSSSSQSSSSSSGSFSSLSSSSSGFSSSLSSSSGSSSSSVSSSSSSGSYSSSSSTSSSSSDGFTPFIVTDEGGGIITDETGNPILNEDYPL